MAETVSWERLRELAAFRAERGCAISLYVSLDPSETPTADDADTRVNSLLDEGERQLSSSGDGLSHEQRMAIKRDFERIQDFFENDFDRDGAQGLAVFSASLDDVWQADPLVEPVPDRVHIGEEFLVAPLVPLIGRGEGAIVAFVGRERGELFRLHAGRLDEIADRSEEVPGKHDQGGWSQSRFQRHIEKLVADHLRDVAEAIDRRVRAMREPKLIVVSSGETRAELEELLSKEARDAVVGWTTAEAHATPADLSELTAPILDQARAREEEQMLERWREAAGRGERASSGWAETLEAASDSKVETLLYAEGVEHEAWRCPKCGRLAAAAGRCPLDDTELEHRDDGLDLAVHQAVAHGGRVFPIASRQDLDPVEGIGAFLRY